MCGRLSLPKGEGEDEDLFPQRRLKVLTKEAK